METSLEINGIRKSYPKGIADLENLLLFLMAHEIPQEELIVEVKVDGEVYSEGFKHQARELFLENLKKIDIATQTKKTFARSFLEQATDYLLWVKQGIRAAARFLREPHSQEQGNEILARSLEVLRAFKDHYENVGDVLHREGRSESPTLSWEAFDSMANRIIALQERRDFSALSNVLEGELVKFLDEWKGTVGQHNG